MQSFSSLNKKKLPFIFGMVSVIVTTCILLLLLVVWLINDTFPSIEEIGVIVFMSGIPMPAFLIAIGWVVWLLERRVRVRALKKSPFNQLHKIGFSNVFKHADTKWFFTEEMLEATIGGYLVQFDVNRNAPKMIEFLVFVDDAELSKEKYNRLKSLLKKENVFFDFEGVVKKYDLRKSFDLTIDQLEKDIILLIEDLKAEGFVPRMD